MTKTYSKTRILVEGAMMIALSTVLSMIQIPLMPHGGSITLFSMVPILVMSYRHGAKWGVMTAFVNSLIQLVQGLGNLAYCQTLTAQVGCVLLDYLLAFTVLGFLCSFLSGYIVWKDYDYAFSWMTEIGFPGISNMSVDGLCWLYSAVYNATYMLPEAILTTVLVVILIRVAPQIFDRQNARA